MMLLYWLADLWRDLKIWRLRRQGLTIADDCDFMSLPDFGSEPYLITIGKHVGIADGVVFITHDGGTHVFRHQERYRKVIKYGRINIMDNCLLGQRVMIMPGVTIGPNSVIAAGSVVTRTIPPNVLASGNPAKPIMSIEQYAEWSLAATPDYDEAEYKRDKRAFLLKMTRKGGRTQPLKEDA